MNLMFEESFSTAWMQRYDAAPASDQPTLGPYLRHRSVRKFSDAPLSEEIVQGLVAAAQSAATSSNLQLWSVVTVQDPEHREAIAKLCANQDHVRDCQWFFCFLADHHRLKKAAAAQGETAEGLPYTEFFTMAIIDAALAAERLVCAAEAIGLGICYIGALRDNAQAVKELLELPEGVFGAFGLCVGWPAEPLTAEIKPRLKQEAVWFRERYQPEVDIQEYDERMREFYVGQGMKGTRTWSLRSGIRVDKHHMTGRETLFPWLRAQGFLLE